MANHTIDCEHCGVDLRLEHPYNVKKIHEAGSCRPGSTCPDCLGHSDWVFDCDSCSGTGTVGNRQETK